MDKEKKVRSALTLQDCKEKVVAEKFKKSYREFYLLAGFPEIISINDEAAEMYASQFSLTPSSREEEQWIPVEERLPEAWSQHGTIYLSDKVLVYDGEDIYTTRYFKEYSRIDNGLIREGWQEFDDITHWKPLSAPPKKLTPK
jgi:hypothetical protein